MSKTYENKYKLGELVWIKSEDDIPMQVKIISIMLVYNSVIYHYAGGDMFSEDEVFDNIKPVTITATELGERYKNLDIKNGMGRSYED